MKILSIECELPGVTGDHFWQHAKAEARKVWELTQAGIVREIYFRAVRNEAVLILESASVQEAEITLSTLPFVQNKLIRFELIPLRAYPGFERLFAEDDRGINHCSTEEANESAYIVALVYLLEHMICWATRGMVPPSILLFLCLMGYHYCILL